MVHPHFFHSFFFFFKLSKFNTAALLSYSRLASDYGRTDLWWENPEVNYLFSSCKGLAISTLNGFLLQCVYIFLDGLRSPLTSNIISHKAICKSH